MAEVTEKTPTQDDIAAVICRRVDAHKQDCASFIADFAEWNRLWLSQADETVYGAEKTTNANTFVPEMFRQVEALTISADAMVHGDDPHYMVKPKVEVGNAPHKSLVTQAVLDKQLYDMGYRMKALNAMRNKVLHGTVFTETIWKFSQVWRITLDGSGYEQATEKDRPDWRVLPIQDCHFWPTKAADIEECDGFAYETEMTERELTDLIDAAKEYGKRIAGVKVKTIQELEAEAHESGAQMASDTTQQIRLDLGYSQDASSGNKTYSVINAYCRYPIKFDDGAENNVQDMQKSKMVWRFLIVNRGGCAIQMPLPFRHGLIPIQRDTLIESPTPSMYGIGLGRVLKNPQLSINARRNLVNDLITFAVYGPWRRKGAPMGTAPKYIKMSPNRVFDDLLDGVLTRMEVDTSAAKPAMELENIEKDEARYATGATAFTQGMTTNSTATEFRGVAQQASLRVASYALSFAENIVKQVLYLCHSMDTQYFLRRTDNQLATKIMVELTGEEGPYSVAATIDDMLPELDIEMKVATDLDYRPQMRRNIKGLAGDLIQIRQATGNEYQWDFIPLIHKMMRLFSLDGRTVVKKMPSDMIPAKLIPAIVDKEISRRVGQIGTPESNAVLAALALRAAPADKEALAALGIVKNQSLETGAPASAAPVPAPAAEPVPSAGGETPGPSGAPVT